VVKNSDPSKAAHNFQSPASPVSGTRHSALYAKFTHRTLQLADQFPDEERATSKSSPSSLIIGKPSLSYGEMDTPAHRTSSVGELVIATSVVIGSAFAVKDSATGSSISIGKLVDVSAVTANVKL
jgi:hypothetical protein